MNSKRYRLETYDGQFVTTVALTSEPEGLIVWEGRFFARHAESVYREPEQKRWREQAGPEGYKELFHD